MGAKLYELTDHLGNVRAVIGDVKLAEGGSFKVDLKSYTNYYPYGMEQPQRAWRQGEDYRYGYNGVEEDDELKGEGNSLSTYYRLYDPRLALWLGIDPVVHESESPYAFSSGNPILYADPSGAEGEIQEFTSPIEDPSQNSEVKDLPNRTVINYNGRNWGKYNNSWTMQSKEVTLRESRSPVGESPHGGYREGQGVNQDPGALSFSPTYTTFNHDGMLYTEENYRNIVLDLVKTLRTRVGNPAAQGFDMESIANGGASDNFYEVLAEADRRYFGTNDFKDGIQNPYLQELHSASNTGMDGTGLLNLWGVGSLARLGGRLVARQLGRKLVGSSPKIGVRTSTLINNGEITALTELEMKSIRGAGPLKQAVTAKEIISQDCEAIAKQTQNIIGGEIIRIEPVSGRLLGEVRVGPESSTEFASGWFYHVAVKKGDRIYDNLTGPLGETISAYKERFLQNDFLKGF